jgi:DNA-binding NarL/FixJ family response regulator
MIRILIADDQVMIRQALQIYLEPETDLEVVGMTDDGLATLEQMEILHPDVALIDIEMPGMDGLTATRTISERFAGTKVLILSSHDDGDYVDRALQSGANGYLLKNTPPHELANAIRSVYHGYFQLGPGLFEKLMSRVSTKRSVEQTIDGFQKDVEQRLVKLEAAIESNAEDVRKLLSEQQNRLDAVEDFKTVEIDSTFEDMKKELGNGFIHLHEELKQQTENELNNVINHLNDIGFNRKFYEQQQVIESQVIRFRSSYNNLKRQVTWMRNCLIAIALVGAIALLILIIVK